MKNKKIRKATIIANIIGIILIIIGIVQSNIPMIIITVIIVFVFFILLGIYKKGRINHEEIPEENNSNIEEKEEEIVIVEEVIPDTEQELSSYVFIEAKVGNGNVLVLNTGLIEISFKTKKNCLYICTCKNVFDWEHKEKGKVVLRLEFSQNPFVLGEGISKSLEEYDTPESIPFKTNFYTTRFESQYQGKRFRLKVWEVKQPK